MIGLELADGTLSLSFCKQKANAAPHLLGIVVLIAVLSTWHPMRFPHTYQICGIFHFNLSMYVHERWGLGKHQSIASCWACPLFLSSHPPCLSTYLSEKHQNVLKLAAPPQKRLHGVGAQVGFTKEPSTTQPRKTLEANWERCRCSFSVIKSYSRHTFRDVAPIHGPKTLNFMTETKGVSSR